MPAKADRAPFAESVSANAAAEPIASGAPETPVPPAPSTFRVAAGKSVACARGQLESGTEVAARDFSGGQPELDELVGTGAIVRA